MKQNKQTSHPTVPFQPNEMSAQVGHDLKNAVLIVSLVLNLTVFTTWLAVAVA